MANLYSDKYFVPRTSTLDRSVSITTANTIEGGEVTWNVTSAAGGAYDLTVANFDSSRWGQYPGVKPKIIIRCGADTSANNVTVKNAAGSTLYTFSSDHSTTAIYILLKLPSDNSQAWELA